MAQLIKLQDYISRYEQDIYRYPSQFVRLKKQQWEGMVEKWEDTDWEMTQKQQQDQFRTEIEGSRPIFEKIKGMFKKNDEDLSEVESHFENSRSESGIFFSPSLHYKPESLEELKQLFLDQVLKFQLKWASSTVSEMSYLQSNYGRNEHLRYLLQRFPDSFLILYKPILRVNKAPVELEIILLTPTDCWCLTWLEAEKDAAFIGSKERFWTKKTGSLESKVLNPAIALSRMEQLIHPIFHANDINLPIKKAILSRNGYIDYPGGSHDIQFIDKRRYNDWFIHMRSLRSPIKHIELKAAQSILDYCQTSAFTRPEWQQETKGEFEE